ncbi:hypothetical protein RJT34_09896 [Clitoria ternatea]|uniref:Uncharacterized protein n=1 Tax=Clitoria ternatea TaxID=43366 RepID=A0AAN9K7F2_CLITE
MYLIPMSMENSKLSADSLAVIDLRHLSQSELYKLSICGGTDELHHHNSFVPKIDPSLFNESAASHQQTYFSPSCLNNTNSTVSTPLDKDFSQIILKHLFCMESSRNNSNKTANDQRN